MLAKETLKDLIDHDTWIASSASLGLAYDRFRDHSWEYMAVLDAGEFVGLCSRDDLGMLLGSQYGYSLNATKSVMECLRPDPVQLIVDSDINEAFERVFTRIEKAFYDDVVILDKDGSFIGLIFTHTLVRLQNHYHKESISLLGHQTRAIESQNLRMQTDLKLCWELQQALLPNEYPKVVAPDRPDTPAFKFRHIYKTHHIVGGDFFHVQQLSAHTVGVLIADVMGHNVRSALVTTMMRALLEELAPRYPDPGDLLTALNGELAKILSRGSHEVVYATACYLTLDASTMSCRLASAAHPAPIRISDESIQYLDHIEGGTLLGVFDDATYSSCEWRLEAGDSLLLYTDGIFEIENLQGDYLGQQGVVDILSAARMKGQADQYLDVLMEGALRFSEGKGFSDDLCLLMIDLQGGDSA